MTTKPTEKWWERLSRIIGGWGMAFYALTMFKPRIVDNKMSIPLIFLLITILALCMSMAHSTVFAITMQTAKGAVPWIKNLFGRGGNSGDSGNRRVSGTGQQRPQDGGEDT